jgi:hypothetical protein
MTPIRSQFLQSGSTLTVESPQARGPGPGALSTLSNSEYCSYSAKAQRRHRRSHHDDAPGYEAAVDDLILGAFLPQHRGRAPHLYPVTSTGKSPLSRVGTAQAPQGHRACGARAPLTRAGPVAMPDVSTRHTGARAKRWSRRVTAAA